MDIIELTKWVVHRGDDLYSLDKQVQFKQKLKKYFAEQLRIDSVVVPKGTLYCEKEEWHDWWKNTETEKQCSNCGKVEAI
jgi:hypothetical protein